MTDRDNILKSQNWENAKYNYPPSDKKLYFVTLDSEIHIGKIDTFRLSWKSETDNKTYDVCDVSHFSKIEKKEV